MNIKHIVWTGSDILLDGVGDLQTSGAVVRVCVCLCVPQTTHSVGLYTTLRSINKGRFPGLSQYQAKLKTSPEIINKSCVPAKNYNHGEMSTCFISRCCWSGLCTTIELMCMHIKRLESLGEWNVLHLVSACLKSGIGWVRYEVSGTLSVTGADGIHIRNKPKITSRQTDTILTACNHMQVRWMSKSLNWFWVWDCEQTCWCGCFVKKIIFSIVLCSMQHVLMTDKKRNQLPDSRAGRGTDLYQPGSQNTG